MPYDLAAVERGYGECTVEWDDARITLRYRADVNSRALIAMKRTIVGVETLDGTARFPDFEAVIDELVHVLLPSGPGVPEHQRGWDLTRGAEPVPVTHDVVMSLPLRLPIAMLMAIFQDLNDPNRRRLSSDFSSLVASSESRRTSGASSETRNGLTSPRGSLPDSLTPETGSAGATGSAWSGTPRSQPTTSAP